MAVCHFNVNLASDDPERKKGSNRKYKNHDRSVNVSSVSSYSLLLFFYLLFLQKYI